MASVYTVTLSNTTPVEITGGRVGHFMVRVESYQSTLFIGGPSLAVSYSPDEITDGFYAYGGSSSFLSFYVTSPDEVYAVLKTQAVSSDTATIFHNR